MVVGAPIEVPRGADADLVERKRVELAGSLNALAERARAIVAGADRRQPEDDNRKR